MYSPRTHGRESCGCRTHASQPHGWRRARRTRDALACEHRPAPGSRLPLGRAGPRAPPTSTWGLCHLCGKGARWEPGPRCRAWRRGPSWRRWRQAAMGVWPDDGHGSHGGEWLKDRSPRLSPGQEDGVWQPVVTDTTQWDSWVTRLQHAPGAGRSRQSPIAGVTPEHCPGHGGEAGPGGGHVVLGPGAPHPSHGSARYTAKCPPSSATSALSRRSHGT